ncbi:hypothetical protein [Flavobacterium limnophilum]|uniref:hypothetical protein n=1 Tax=Flavobacterium limnophilum TaxID=3003262 RepID=UPI0024828DF1|nr:hypothetical protein [Flavobacterium limnophilum]
MKNKIATIIILCSVSFFTSYDAKSQNQAKIENWYGKKIILPSAKLMRSDNKKHTNPLSRKIKIVTVINGSCGACVIELKKWKDYMRTVDTSQVGFIYLIQSEDDLFTFKELNRDFIKLSYPYFYDIKKAITKANKLTDNMAYHTFLLNNKNEVILVGNPNKDKKIFDQYKIEINKRTPKKNPSVGVKEGVNGTTIKISNGSIYKDKNGKILSTVGGIKWC